VRILPATRYRLKWRQQRKNLWKSRQQWLQWPEIDCCSRSPRLKSERHLCFPHGTPESDIQSSLTTILQSQASTPTQPLLIIIERNKKHIYIWERERVLISACKWERVRESDQWWRRRWSNRLVCHRSSISGLLYHPYFRSTAD
jgi:hypothetical protein